MKVCDFCLEEQGVMNVQVHPNAQVLPVSVRWGTGRDELDFHIDLCVAHREMIERCYNRRFAS